MLCWCGGGWREWCVWSGRFSMEEVLLMTTRKPGHTRLGTLTRSASALCLFGSFFSHAFHHHHRDQHPLHDAWHPLD